jgi:hypothetical protein
VHTLSELKSGKLVGISKLTLADNLREFPREILTLADTLEILDLSNNQLTSLPDEIKQLTKLKILFASNNKFETLPESLGQCPNLEMIGFKANQISQLPGNALPAKLRWLILTDNKLTHLPNTLGERLRLQKLALSGNQLTQLPDNFSQLINLELLRIAANQLSSFPDQLLTLPKLAWLAMAGNPFTQVTSTTASVPQVASANLTLQEILGQGASGVISKAIWTTQDHRFPKEIAVKIFKGELTTDGYPKDEMQACLKVGAHANLVKPLAHISEDNCLALVMDLIPQHYRNLGQPPSFDSCTRDTFESGFRLSIEHINKIVSQMKSVFTHLHSKKVCHGDLYAHNTLIDNDANMIFGDFGAATMYHMFTPQQQEHMVTIEGRALHYFIQDLLSICVPEDRNSKLYQQLEYDLTSLR